MAVRQSGADNSPGSCGRKGDPILALVMALIACGPLVKAALNMAELAFLLDVVLIKELSSHTMIEC